MERAARLGRGAAVGNEDELSARQRGDERGGRRIAASSPGSPFAEPATLGGV